MPKKLGRIVAYQYARQRMTGKSSGVIDIVFYKSIGHLVLPRPEPSFTGWGYE